MKMRKLVHTCLSVLFLIHVYGCVTPKAIKYAEEKASKPKIYKKILNIYPIAFREKGNIKLCVTLSCESEERNEENYVVYLPVESLSLGETNPEKMDLVIDPNSVNPYLPVYWFPIEEPSKNCTEIAAMEIQSGSEIHVEELFVPVNKWDSFHKGIQKNKDEIITLLHSYNKGALSDGNVYAINTVRLDDLTTVDTFLTYFSEKNNNPEMNGMSLIGGYHDPSTQAGYALVPLAIIADIAIVALIIAGFVIVIIGGIYGAFN